MSIIRCPNCSKQISSRATSCSHCGHSMGVAHLGPTERQAEQEDFRQRKMRKLRSRLDLGAVAAASALALVFIAWWWHRGNSDVLTQKIYIYVISALAIAYVALRVWKLIIRKR